MKIKMFNKDEVKILEKFTNGANIELYEEYFLDKVSLIGLVKFGMFIEDDKIIKQATLTKKGKRYIQELRLMTEIVTNL